MEQPKRRRSAPRVALTERIEGAVLGWFRSAPGGWLSVVLLVVAHAGAGFSVLSVAPSHIEGDDVLAFERAMRSGGAIVALAAVAAALWRDGRGLERRGERELARTWIRRATVLAAVAVVIGAAAALASGGVGARRGLAFFVVLVGGSALRGAFVAWTRGGDSARRSVAELLVALATLPWAVELASA
jgi:hypothetical protein